MAAGGGTVAGGAGAARVAVASLGGTITMTAASAGAGVTPSLQAADLVRSVPGLAEVAELTATTLRTEPGAWLTPPDVAAVAAWAREQPVDGVVVVQGTDTIEETAYLLDLLWDRPEPLVVTGAMRPPTAAGPDGPANVLAAAVVAADAAARDRGVLVVLDDDVHAAARVRKTDTVAAHAFTSVPFGPVGRVHERRVTFAAPAARWPALPAPRPDADPRVALLETHLGDRGDLLRSVADAGYDGIVLAGFGAGHLSAAAAEVVGEVAPRCPVVLASRTGAGPVLTGTYGFVGSERDLLARGAVPAGWLDGRKARLLLWALLAAGAGPAEVRAAITARGAAPGGPHGETVAV
ncbi:asparaginase [Geodermatophilus sp. YIM 151500]|uniref:asparaginase n=1 Tax=Geodermatophilus sp. YIM 151500 TaxID=2984531 RepID=UPI0021E3B071|nr:asparaginase [Geodermatophilus sp. YIM 151500]MCV2488840.1 asparaginase [Geodermatophilus sp. YIM 151500]